MEPNDRDSFWETNSVNESSRMEDTCRIVSGSLIRIHHPSLRIIADGYHVREFRRQWAQRARVFILH